VGAAQILQELDVPDIKYAKYCDEALLKLKVHISRYSFSTAI